MANLRLSLPVNDDAEHKRTIRGDRRAGRRKQDLERAPVPDRSCMTCHHWYQTAPQWGECTQAVVVRQRVGAEVSPPDGIEAGTIIAQGERQWWHAKTFGRAEGLQTHRTFVACSRYERAMTRQHRRQGPSLVARAKGQIA